MVNPPPSKGARRDRGAIAAIRRLGKGRIARRHPPLRRLRTPQLRRQTRPRAMSLPVHPSPPARPAAVAFAAMGIVWGTFAAFAARSQGDARASDALPRPADAGSRPCGASDAMLVAPAAWMRARAASRCPWRRRSPWRCLRAAGADRRASGSCRCAMMLCGAATGLTDVLMNARVSRRSRTSARLHLMNLCHAAYSRSAMPAGRFGTGLARSADCRRRLGHWRRWR